MGHSAEGRDSLLPEPSNRYYFVRPQLSRSLKWICSLWYSVRAVDESWVALVQALALMAAFRDEWPCMIIVPSSLRGDRRFARLLCMQAQATDAAVTPEHFHRRQSSARGRASLDACQEFLPHHGRLILLGSSACSL